MAVVTGERRFQATPERVFALLVDPDVVVEAMPAVHSHRVLGPDSWEARVKAPVPFAPSITIHFEVVDKRPPHHATMRANGPGADVSSTFDLEADGNETVMRWHTDLHLHGLLGVLAVGGVDALARRQAQRSLDAVEQALEDQRQS
jgi:carbon monoxide dehydrogenase subunit G